jgi:hypothetical protein
MSSRATTSAYSRADRSSGKIGTLPVEDDLLSGGEIEKIFRHCTASFRVLKTSQ